MTKASRDTTWSVRGRNGRWTIRFRDGAKWREHSLGVEVKTKAQAEYAARQWLMSSQSEGEIGPSVYKVGPKVFEIAERWIELRKKNERLAPATVRDNIYSIGVWIVPKLGEMEVSQLSVPMLRAWIRDIRSKISSSRCRNLCSTLRIMLDDAAADGWVKLSPNPMRDSGVLAEIPVLQREFDGIAYFEPEHVQALLDDNRIPMHRRLRYLFAAGTGMRDGEIAGLRWSDIELDEPVPVAHVRQAIKFGEKGKLNVGAPKTRESKRTIPLAEPIAEALKLFKADGWEQRAGRVLTSDSYVFTNARGELSRPDSPKLLRADLQANECPTVAKNGQPFTFHHLRHSFATWLADAGVPSEIREVLLGHSGTTTQARHYSAATMQRLKAAVAQVPLSWPVLFVPADSVEEGVLNEATVCPLGSHVGSTPTDDPSDSFYKENSGATHGTRTHDLRFTNAKINNPIAIFSVFLAMTVTKTTQERPLWTTNGPFKMYPRAA